MVTALASKSRTTDAPQRRAREQQGRIITAVIQLFVAGLRAHVVEESFSWNLRTTMFCPAVSPKNNYQ